jgi:hypothetical protein
MQDRKLTDWLLKGDISIQYQTLKDLFGKNDRHLQERIHQEGWAARILTRQRPDDHWGMSYYRPKWTSTHYTLLDLRNLYVFPNIPSVNSIINRILTEEKGSDGGINPSGNIKNSDVCINGMALNFCSYFRADQELLTSVVDFILSQRLKDGGFNCQLNRIGAVHSSLHSTISVLEGLREYLNQGYEYRDKEVREAEAAGQDFILLHKLYKSDRTGKVIKDSFLRFPYPYRWYYNILRALDYFRYSKRKFSHEMEDAYNILMKKRMPDGRWKINAKHPGEEHFSMEKPGSPSRWNTLLALRVKKWKNDSSS